MRCESLPSGSSVRLGRNFFEEKILPSKLKLHYCTAAKLYRQIKPLAAFTRVYKNRDEAAIKPP
jgi:hypothetical protein